MNVKLFNLTTITQAVGEGGISTGGSPNSWGALGPSVSGASTDGAGTTVTRANGWLASHTHVAGDQLQVVSGSAGTSTGLKTVSSKVSNDALLLSASIGANKTTIVAYMVRSSLAGGLLDTPTALPGAHVASTNYERFAAYRNRDQGVVYPSKILRFGTALALSDSQTLSDWLATRSENSFLFGLGFRLADLLQDGSGSQWQVNVQPRNASGVLSSVIANTSFYDGGAADSGDFYQYFQPEQFQFSLTKAEASNSLAFNLNLQQLTGDVSEGASLPGVNGPILAVYYSDAAAGPRGRKRGRGRWAIN
ncbi:MAG: hypothetical protein JSS51_03525 [Planctomycetes bacterium]|nr:hypothetical protein [Planctomycetota bacterium]